MNSVGIDLHHNARMSRCLETTPRDYSRGGLPTSRGRSWSCSGRSRASPRLRLRRSTAEGDSRDLLEEAGYELHLAHPLRHRRPA